MKSERLTLLIDADTLIYTAASSNEFPIQWSEWLWTLHADFNACVTQLDSMVEEIMKGLGSENVIMALSDEHRWRPKVMPEYKSNRSKTRKPVCYAALREYVKEKYDSYQRPELEGDDVLGILSTHPTLIEGRKIIVSIDKDMKTIPGLLCNYSKDRVAGEEWTVHSITEEQADYQHMFQTLTGDATDGYKGCPKIGPVKAEGLLNNTPRTDWWKMIVGCYRQQGLGEEVALQNARVARILRYTDYDYKNKEVILWEP